MDAARLSDTSSGSSSGESDDDSSSGNDSDSESDASSSDNESSTGVSPAICDHLWKVYSAFWEQTKQFGLKMCFEAL